MKNMIFFQTMNTTAQKFTDFFGLALRSHKFEPTEIVLLVCAAVIFAAILAFTVIMAVRIIREKTADKRAERAIAEKKWKEFEDKTE